MATDGAGGETPAPVQALTAAAHGGLRTKCDFNIDTLSRSELLTLLSIMEGELEARDLVIETLRARRKEVFIQERYGHFNLSDPFLALQRDFEAGAGDKERRSLCSSPLSVLEAVMAHCRKMQERMSVQLEAAEGRQKKLEQEKLQLQSLEVEHRKLSAQLKDEREKNKHVVMMLVRECKQLASRVAEESQRFDELSARLEEEGRVSNRLQEELTVERHKGQQMEAEMEKQLSEMDTDREQLRARLGREEARSADLRAQSDCLRQKVEQLQVDQDVGRAPPAGQAAQPKATVSVAVATDPLSCHQASCQTDPSLMEDGPRKAPLTVPVKPSVSSYAGMSLPKSQNPPRAMTHGNSISGMQTENGLSSSPGAGSALPAGASPRVQAARYKFQSVPTEQDQNGNATPSPPSRDESPTSRDNLAAKQQARHTVTQVLSRFTSPPTAGPLRPGLPHSTSEGGPFPGRLSHSQMSIKSPTVGRIDRGNPPPIPPKKPGLSQTPSPPHPPIKVVGEGSRSPATSLGSTSKPATPQLPPKPAIALGGTGGGCPVPALTASQVGACPPQPSGPHQGACSECPPVAITAVSSSSINPVIASCCRPRDTELPLAAASGWCPAVVPPLGPGGPRPPG